jgi:hypothetical protein
MKTKGRHISFFLNTCVLIVFFFSCRKKSNDTVTQVCTYVPSYVDTTINLKDISLFTLRTKGYAYLKSGSRRIILYKESDTQYTAFDRASTYKMAEVGCMLVVDTSAFFMKDTCSGSKFDFKGNVIQEPAICPLLEYATTFVGSDQLRIYYTGQ